jgi:hypothetical protein
MLFSGKLNKLRTLALGLVFIGIAVMYLGYVGFAGYLGALLTHNMVIMAIFLVLGLFCVIGSSVMYMWIGIVSTKAVQVYCPSCNRVTKIVGIKDECMFCKQRLSLDPKDAPKL